MDLEVFKESLDLEVDKFIEWYYLNRVKGSCHDVNDDKNKVLLMRNFIEKMAVWYELRYPDYEIKYSVPGSGKKPNCVNTAMFDENNYISHYMEKNHNLVWAEFYNTSAFIRSLSSAEKRLMMRPRYIDKVYIDRKQGTPFFELSKNGNVVSSVNIKSFSQDLEDGEIVGKNIADVVKLFKEKSLELPDDNELEKAIVDYSDWVKQKREMLNCVMYRIIERGRNVVGPRRALLFAKEFNLNVDIPMIYGIDLDDADLRYFINDYLKLGGDKNLECYKNYFNLGERDVVLLSDILSKKCINKARYTEEEKKLYTKLVGSLSNELDEEKIKEKIQKQRIKRKLLKSKKNTH